MDKEKIMELKKKNGNKYIKNNDLLWYILSRMDDIENEITNYKQELTTVKVTQKVFWFLLPCAIAITALIMRSYT